MSNTRSDGALHTGKVPTHRMASFFSALALALALRLSLRETRPLLAEPLNISTPSPSLSLPLVSLAELALEVSTSSLSSSSPRDAAPSDPRRVRLPTGLERGPQQQQSMSGCVTPETGTRAQDVRRHRVHGSCPEKVQARGWCHFIGTSTVAVQAPGLATTCGHVRTTATGMSGARNPLPHFHGHTAHNVSTRTRAHAGTHNNIFTRVTA